MTTRFEFSPERLDGLARRSHDAFVRAEPFPNVVLHDLVPPDVLREVATEFPDLGDRSWRRYQDSQQQKLAAEDVRSFGPCTRGLVAELNGPTFLEFLERLTGIDGIIPDPYLRGGGLHQIETGGHLDVHVDFDKHERFALDRRLNLLVYLNEDWDDSWGGALELWDDSLTGPRVTISPRAGTCVLFETSDISYHGHPAPLRSPEGVKRRSLALYYYTAPTAISDIRHTTRFATGRRTWKERLRPFVPPIIVDQLRRR